MEYLVTFYTVASVLIGGLILGALIVDIVMALAAIKGKDNG